MRAKSYVNWCNDWHTLSGRLRLKIVRDYSGGWHTDPTNRNIFVKADSVVAKVFEVCDEILIPSTHHYSSLHCPGWLIPLIPTLANISDSSHSKALKILIKNPEKRKFLSTLAVLSNGPIQEDELFDFLNRKSLVETGD